MTYEIIFLLLALLLLLAQTFAEGFITGRTYGLKTASEGRDDIPLIQPGKPGRLYRAIQNYKENLFYFIPLVLLTAILDVSNNFTVAGVTLFLIARIVYVPLYVFSVPWFRGVAFGFGLIGCFSIAYGLFL